MALSAAYHRSESAAVARMFFPVLTFGAFLAAVVTDISYWQTFEIQWANFSAWLLAVGTALGSLSLLLALVDLLRWGRARWNGALGWSVLMMLLSLIAAFADNLVHGRDGWTSVVPWGLALSLLTTVLVAIALVLKIRVDELNHDRRPA